MVDPARQTGVARGYSYQQLFTRPFIGGGFISALSVPLIAALGLPIFTILALFITVGMNVWEYDEQLSDRAHSRAPREPFGRD
jgi:glutamate:Na+ symporter, ESS family